MHRLAKNSGSAIPRHAIANALAEMPLPWQSKVVIIKLYRAYQDIWLLFLARLITCLCHAMNSVLAPPLAKNEDYVTANEEIPEFCRFLRNRWRCTTLRWGSTWLGRSTDLLLNRSIPRLLSLDSKGLSLHNIISIKSTLVLVDFHDLFSWKCRRFEGAHFEVTASECYKIYD